MAWVTSVHQHDTQLQLTVGKQGMKIPEVVRLARKHGFVISAIGEHKPSLEDVFLHYIGKDSRDGDYEQRNSD